MRGLSPSSPPLPDAFDRRLQPRGSAPIAVAFSGGGDSVMALKLTKTWADAHGRSVIALSVDHRLQAASGEWLDHARGAAGRLGVDFRALAWVGDKPSTGLPAAARAARHRLIAEAAREAGARVVVFGHTADDVLEGELMRSEGLRLGHLREWSPSPVWPEGRGVFLLRPLLRMRRAAIREALIEDGERWIDDPANEDIRSPRVRARIRLRTVQPNCASGERQRDDEALSALARQAVVGEDASIRLGRQAFRDAEASDRRRLLAAALTCAGGQAGSPRGGRLNALAARLNASDPFTATLGGAKVLAGDEVLIVRDAGEFKRRRFEPLVLAADQSGVWDGRFEIVAGPAPVVVQSLAGQAKALPSKALTRLRTLNAAIRPTLPAVDAGEAGLTCPILADDPSVRVRSLVKERFLAACGVFSKEAAT